MHYLREPKPSKDKISIGNNDLYLELENKHEFRYFMDKFDVDAAIADIFVKVGDKVLDAGANIGFCSLHYLKNGASKVEAYEPQSHLHKRLVSLEDKRLKVHKIALSDEVGNATLYISKSHNQGHTINKEICKIHPRIFGKKITSEAVEVSTLDTLYARGEEFDFIKLDVEGVELKVIKGGTNLFRCSKNGILQIEIKDEFLDEYLEVLNTMYTHIYRVLYSKSDCSLYITKNFDAPARKGYLIYPPNYLCSNKALMVPKTLLTDMIVPQWLR